MSTTLLCIETATEACSVALKTAGETLSRSVIAPRRHSTIILDMVSAILAECGISGTALDALAFGKGPGSFTGLRIAAGVTQGLAWGWDKAVIPVSTLAVLAQGFAQRYSHVCPALDARMGEIYWGVYQREPDGLMRALDADRRGKPETLPDTDSETPVIWQAVGPGWTKHTALLSKAPWLGHCIRDESDATALPNATAMVALADALWQAQQYASPSQALPAYLREQVAQPPAR